MQAYQRSWCHAGALSGNAAPAAAAAAAAAAQLHRTATAPLPMGNSKQLHTASPRSKPAVSAWLLLCK